MDKIPFCLTPPPCPVNLTSSRLSCLCTGHLLTCLVSDIAQLLRCEPISEEHVKRLCLKAREILLEEGNVQVVDAPVTVSSFSALPSSFLISHLDMWRHSRPILRYDGAFQSRWLLPTDKLSLHGYIHFSSLFFYSSFFRRLCRSWFLLCRNIFASSRSQSSISRSYHSHTR